MNIEARLVKLEHVRFTKSKKNLKIIQISDIHINFLMVSKKRILSMIQEINPDFIILTGDYISEEKHCANFLKLLTLIKGTTPVFACLGNHEYRAFKNGKEGLKTFVNQMENLGVKVLRDSSASFEKNSKIYNIIGFEDFSNRKNDTLEAIKAIPSDSSVCIAISHNPEIVYHLPSNKIDYLFTGHFHGGQIWAPFHIEFKLMRNETLCKIGITRGLHKVNGIKLYISRGLGNICFPFRFFSRPEITVFYIP